MRINLRLSIEMILKYLDFKAISDIKTIEFDSYK